MSDKTTEVGHIRIFAGVSENEDIKVLERAQSLLSDARSIGCIEALEEHNHYVQYLTDPIRENYIDFLDLEPSDEALEIGSSMGQHTGKITKRCRSVNALEVVEFQEQASRLWCRQDGLHNVYVTAGDSNGRHSCDDDTFDVVVSNYVLEWRAGRLREDPDEFHQAVLREIRRVLRLGGRLFLSAKNRFAFKYFSGTENKHLGIRFSSTLPGLIQGKVAAKADLGDPTGYLHSWRELWKQLRSAGFAELRLLFTYPDTIYLSSWGGHVSFRRLISFHRSP